MQIIDKYEAYANKYANKYSNKYANNMRKTQINLQNTQNPAKNLKIIRKEMRTKYARKCARSTLISSTLGISARICKIRKNAKNTQNTQNLGIKFSKINTQNMHSYFCLCHNRFCSLHFRNRNQSILIRFCKCSYCFAF